jgi:hypothetical protein
MVGMEVRVTGANDLAQVVGAINRLTPGLRKEFLGAVRKAVKPAILDVKEKAVEDLPRAGGLNQFVKKSTIGVRTRTSGASTGVRVVARKAGHDLAAIDQGRLRHPLFGNRHHWYGQDVHPGFFSETIRRHAPEAQAELVKVMEQFLERIKTESHT